MTQGSKVGEHSNPGEATVLVPGQGLLAERGSFRGRAVRGLVIVSDTRHSLETTKTAAVLLTVASWARPAGRAQRCETRLAGGLAARPAMVGRPQREVSVAYWQGMQSLAIGKVSRCSNGIAASQCSQFP
jgi:hypothetical protein